MKFKKCVLVTGGAGYVGTVLVSRLLAEGHRVKVLDLYLFGDNVLNSVKDHPGLSQIRGDIRDEEVLRSVVSGCDAVIHLAAISNDPSFELNPTLSRSINYDAMGPLVNISKEMGVNRFIFASTSSVYGVSDVENVTETHPLLPITDYNKYKGLSEPILLNEQSSDFTAIVVRPATVCGYSPRQRLDLAVNILTSQAIHSGQITVFGGGQMRPNIHIRDVVDLYTMLLEVRAELVGGRIYNAGYQNLTISQIALMVKEVIESETSSGSGIDIVTTPSDDRRSYHISSEKIRRELGFVPRYGVEDAVRDLLKAFQEDKIPNSMTDPRYYNIRTMQELNFK